MVNIVILLRQPYFHGDDWNLFHLFLQSDNIYKSVLSRYNQHPSYLLSAIQAINLLKFNGHTLWLVVINSIALLLVSSIYFNVLLTSLRKITREIHSLALASVLMAFVFWMANGIMMFWSIGYIPILGVVIATYGLTKQDKWGFKKGTSLYFIGSFIISVSFGTGAISWWLGFLSSLLQRQSKGWIAFFFLVGVLGSLITMGYYALSNDSVRSSDFTTLMLAVPAFIGAPSSIAFVEFVSEETLTYLTLLLGFVGILIFCYFLWRYYKSTKQNHKCPAKLFFILICFFVIGCSLLIAHGRMKNDLMVMMRGQYFSWSIMFWYSIIGLVSIEIVENKIFKKFKNRTFYLGLLIFTMLLLYNTVRINLRLPAYNSNVKGILDVIIHPDSEGNEKLLWHPNNDYPHLRKKVFEVMKEIQSRKINVYSEEWPHLLGQSFTENCMEVESDFLGRFEMSSDTNDIFIKGYLSSNKSYNILPKTIAIVSLDTIVGFGLPFSNRDEMKVKTGKINNLFNILPRPFSQFPGVSNYYFCQMSPNVKEKTISEFDLYGLDGLKAKRIRLIDQSLQ